MIGPESQLREIAEHEAWLGQTLLPEERVSLEHLKRRVRVQIGEQWLAQELQEPPASSSIRDALRIRVRDAVMATRRSVADHRPADRTSRIRPWVVGAGLGLAALIAFTFNISPNGESVVVDSDLPEVSAFEEALEVEDFDSALTQLEEELDSFDALLAVANEDEWMDDSTGL
jgi:hypothetical protein